VAAQTNPLALVENGAEMTLAEFIDVIHANSKIIEVDLIKLQVDGSYQRDINETLVDEIANDWDEIASELILVSDRGKRPADSEVKGGLFVINGQHRSKAAQKKGLTKIWARVIYLQDHPDPGAIEADFRLKTNKRVRDNPLERFKAQLRAGVEESEDIVKILKKLGTYINTANLPETGINAVATIEQVYRFDEGSLLGDTGRLIKDTFGEFQGRYASSSFVKGVAWFIDKHAEETDRDRLSAKLKELGLSGLMNRARTTRMTMMGSEWLNVYRVLVDMYNENLSEKNRLHWKYRGSGRMSRTEAGATART